MSNPLTMVFAGGSPLPTPMRRNPVPSPYADPRRDLDPVG
jgi:hypothetical protein